MWDGNNKYRIGINRGVGSPMPNNREGQVQHACSMLLLRRKVASLCKLVIRAGFASLELDAVL